MRIPKTLLAGVLGSILLGVLLATAQASVSEKPDDSPVTVPVGRTGDRVAYGIFQGRGYEYDFDPKAGQETVRFVDEQGWRLMALESFDVARMTRTADATGLAHDVALVKSNYTFPETYAEAGEHVSTTYEYVDMATRKTIRSDFKSEATFRHSGSSSFAVSDFEVRDASLPGVIYQGLSFQLGQDVTELHPLDADFRSSYISFASSSSSSSGPLGLLGPGAQVRGDVRREDVPVEAVEPPAGLEYRCWVGDRATINGRDAYALRCEATAPVPRLGAAEYNAMSPEDRKEYDEFRDGKIRYAVTRWVSGDVPYPLLEQAEFAVVKGDGEERVLEENSRSLLEYAAGSGALPWGEDVATEHFRSSNPDAERTSGSQTHPVDGSGSRLVFPLSEALAQVASDPTLIRYRLWQQTHLGALLVSAELSRGELSREGSPSHNWHLVFAEPSGAAYEVSVERPAASGRGVSNDLGERTVPPFSIADLPPNPVTWAAAERLWASVASPEYAGRAPNFAHWGFDLDYRSAGPTCPVVSTHAGAAKEPLDDLRRLLVGYGSSGSCLENSDTAEQSAVVVRTESGNVEGAFEMRVDFDYRGFAAPKGDLVRPEAVPSRVPAGVQPPAVDRAAVASTSLLAVFLAVYFLPVLKFAAAQGLLLLPGYSKLARSELLDNKVRDQILETIKANPGIHASDLGRRLDAGWGTVVYHLHVLEKNKLVTSLVDGRHKRFFPVGAIDWSKRGQAAVLMNAMTKQLFELITEEPGVIQGLLAQRVGLAVPSAIWHLKRLEECGLVGRVKEGRKVHYFPNEPAPTIEPYDPKDAVEVA